MKSRIKNRLLLVTAICSLLAGTSCQYDEIVDIPYPESRIYLPIAVNGSISTDGIYTIDEGASTSWVSPTPGQPLKYTVERDNNAFIIPLGVYRSGTGKTIKGTANVSLALNPDTVQQLIASGTLTETELLPSEYVQQIPQGVQIQDGKNDAPFNIVIDLDFLRADAPKKYALGITISDTEHRVNEALNTGIVLIDTRITVPQAVFTSQLEGSSSDTFVFTNSSLYWDFFSGDDAFAWDFGDGSAISHEINPTHHYAAAGDYEVTLTVTGVTGENVSVTNTVSVKNN